MRCKAGCELLYQAVTGGDVGEFEIRSADWWREIPAGVSCSRFKLCDRCPADPPEAERRGGETRREFYDRIRVEMLAQPVLGQGDADA